MSFKTITLTYKGHGLFAAKPKLTLRKGQTLHAYIGRTPITDATYGAMKIASRRLARRLALDPELSALNS